MNLIRKSFDIEKITESQKLAAFIGRNFELMLPRLGKHLVPFYTKSLR